ncbi:MAG: DUF2270 domain-containing protein [Acidobacteriota bacterium]
MNGMASSDFNTEMLQVDPDCDLEGEPLTRPEYLTVMVHFYRAEVGRSTLWRSRLDATTNWAVLTSAGMLSFVFASPASTHILVLLSNLIIMAFLIIEGRRYRYFEVYRARVRMLEENFLLPVLTRHLVSPMERWREELAQDLDAPRFKCSRLQAIGFRLRRNYVLIFGVLLGAWWVKLGMHPTLAESFTEVFERAHVGHFSPWLIFGVGLIFYLSLVVLFILGLGIHGDAGPADEVEGITGSLSDWKL